MSILEGAVAVGRKLFTGFGLGMLLSSLVLLTVFAKGVDILSLVAAATSSLSNSRVTLYFTPYKDSELHVGETETLDVKINAEDPINAVGATIIFPSDAIEIVGFSKEKSFLNLWTEETAIHETTGEIHFSGGTTQSGGMTGAGTLLTINIRPKKSGSLRIAFADSEVYAADGGGTKLDTDTRSLLFSVRDREKNSESTSIGNSQTLLPQPLQRTRDVNTDGSVNVVDVSIMVMRLLMPYDYHFDINMDGSVNVEDVSIVLASIR